MIKNVVVMLMLLLLLGCGGGSSTSDAPLTPEPSSPSQPTPQPTPPPTQPPPPTPTPPPTETGQLIIEEMTAGFCAAAGVIESENPGFTGEGYTNTYNVIDAQIQWQLNAEEASSVSVEIRYAAATDRPALIRSNDQEVDLAFVSSNGFDLWTTETFTLDLIAGENNITLLSSTNEGAPNIDSIKITGDGLSAGSCTFVAIDAPPASTVKVFAIGDSTVANYGASSYPQAGWGQMLGFFFDSNEIEVVNRARGGRSSRSYYTQAGIWNEVLSEIDSGDYVLIQFGHNDRDASNPERYTSTSDYEEYLSNYVTEIRAKSATPILVSPMILNAYNGDTLRNVFTENGNDYRGAMAAVAQRLDAAFIDLNLMSFDLASSLGQEQASRYLFLNLLPGEYPNYPDGISDNTHFQEFGALEMARLIIEGLEGISGNSETASGQSSAGKAISQSDSANLRALIGHLKPRYPLSIEQVGANGSVTQVGSFYPEGVPLSLKPLTGNNDTFSAWYSFGQSVADTEIFQTTMPANRLSVVASFNNVVPTFNFDAATVFLIGDSTVSDYTANKYPQTGWGQVLQPFFDESKISIDNRALGGRSSKSFYNDHWEDVKASISEGDYVFIQFGINDRARDEDRAAPTGGPFEGFLTSFVEETRELGAIPVLVTSVRRNEWRDGVPYDSYHEHPGATREVAASLNVPLIDLDTKNKALLEEVGENYANRFYYMGLQPDEYENFANGVEDTVHFQEAGAVEIARIVSESIAEFTSSAAMAALIDALNPTYQLNITSPTPEAGSFTKGFSYPSDTPLTIKAIANEGNVFTQWLDDNRAQVTDKAIYQFTGDDAPMNFEAVFNNSEGLGQATTNLVTEFNGSHIVVSWDLQNFGAEITDLELYRNDVNALDGRERLVAGAQTSGSFVDESGVEGTTYWYMFKVTQGEQITNTDPEAEIRWPFVNEVPVTNLVAVVNGTSVDLSWDLKYFNPEISYMEVYRNDKNELLGRTRIVAGAPLAGTFTDTGLEPGKTYWYMFKLQQGGETVNTEPDAETLIPLNAAKTNLVSTVNGDAIDLSWDLQNFDPAITAVELYRNDANQQDGRERILSGAPINGTFKDETAVPGVSYWYMFKITQGEVTSNTAPEAQAMVPTGEPTTNLVSSLVGATVELTWDIQHFGSGITSIELYRNTTNELAGRSRILQGAELSGSFIDTGVVSGQQYWYMFKINQNGVIVNTEPEASITVP